MNTPGETMSGSSTIQSVGASPNMCSFIGRTVLTTLYDVISSIVRLWCRLSLSPGGDQLFVLQLLEYHIRLGQHHYPALWSSGD